jgi:glutamyl-tRNA synthetase
LGDDGQKLSKRRGAVSVTAYEESGYLPEAMLNYLARLGWSHGDEELFSREQLVTWFDGTHLNKSPAQWDPVKLLWVNAQYIKQSDNHRLAGLVAQQMVKLGVALDPAAIENHLPHLCALLKDRCDTTVTLAQWVAKFYGDVTPDAAELEKHLTDSVRPAISTLTEKLQLCVWDKASIAAAIKDVLAAHGLKMPQLAMPVRVLVMGTAQTPSLDSVLEMCGREKVVERLRKA